MYLVCSFILFPCPLILLNVAFKKKMFLTHLLYNGEIHWFSLAIFDLIR